VHPFSHYGEGAASQEDQQALEGAACDQCVAYAGFAGALPGAHGVPPAVAAGSPRLGTAPAPSATAALRLPRARDPPFFL
jgi:hypothetical protein